MREREVELSPANSSAVIIDRHARPLVQAHLLLVVCVLSCAQGSNAEVGDYLTS